MDPQMKSSDSPAAALTMDEDNLTVARSASIGSLSALLADPQLSSLLEDVNSTTAQGVSQSARLEYEQTVRQYYYQLMQGCGNEACSNKLCRSSKLCRYHAKLLQPDVAAVLAVHLASRPVRFFCQALSLNLKESLHTDVRHSSSELTSDPTTEQAPVPPSRQEDVVIPNSLSSIFAGFPRFRFPSAPPVIGIAPGNQATLTSNTSSMSTPSSPVLSFRSISPPSDGVAKSNTPPVPFLNSLLSSSSFASIFNPSMDVTPDVPPFPTLRPSFSKSNLKQYTSFDALQLANSDQRKNASSSVIAPSPCNLELVQANSSPKEIQTPSKLSSFLDFPASLVSSVTSKFTRSISQQLLPAKVTPCELSSTSITKSYSNISLASFTSEGIADAVDVLTRHESTSEVQKASNNRSRVQSGIVLKYLTRELWESSVQRLASYPASNGSQLEENRLDPPSDEAITISSPVSSPTLPQSDINYLDEEAHHFLLASVKYVFSNSDALNKSFLNELGDAPTSPLNLDLNQVRETYDAILSQEPIATYTRSLSDGIELLLAQLSLDPLIINSKSKLRQILILLCNPLLKESMYHETLMRPLLLLITRLKKSAKAALVQLLATFPPQNFLFVVQNSQLYLSTHFYSFPRPDEGIIANIRFLGLCYSANELGNLISFDQFYNPVLGLKLLFKEEYRIWKRLLDLNQDGLANEFSYFNYPFLFDPISKARIMHIDAMVQMAQEYEDVCFSQALVVHTQQMLVADSQRSSELEHQLRHMTNPYLVMEVSRTNLVEDAFSQLHLKASDLKKPLKVKFKNEDGMDQGGVQKEFFQVVLNKLLDPLYSMFSYDEETRYSWFNQDCLEPIQMFEFAGIILGLAVYNGVIVDVRFPKLMYDMLIGDSHCSLEDVCATWPELGRGLKQMLEWNDGDVEDVFCRTFEVETVSFGAVKSVELIPGGASIPVTNNNRKEYVDKYVHWLCSASIADKATALRKGFLRVCGGYALNLCRAEELELLMCGTELDLDFSQLEACCEYDDGYSEKHPLIRSFWKLVHSFSLVHKKRLLEFVTASDRIPLKGLGSLTFVIQRNGPDSDRLPTSLTCFGRLLLPEYSSPEKMERYLLTAIENAKGFGLV
jgi:hypothetical protein